MIVPPKPGRRPGEGGQNSAYGSLLRHSPAFTAISRPPHGMALYLVTGGAGFIGSHLVGELVAAATACAWSTT
jgi:hypothetical protein